MNPAEPITHAEAPLTEQQQAEQILQGANPQEIQPAQIGEPKHSALDKIWNNATINVISYLALH